jgi:hypothetical protein
MPRPSGSPLFRRTELPERHLPVVVKGCELLAKELLVHDERLGVVHDIQEADLDPNPGSEVGITDGRCAILLELSGTLLKAVAFADVRRSRRGSRIVDVDGDHVCEFLCVSDGGAYVLFDHNGDELWTRGALGSYVGTRAYGDIDGDGRLEFVQKGSRNIALVGSDGRLVWWRKYTRAAAVNSVHVVDIDGDTAMEIVGVAQGRMTILDSNGEDIREVPTPKNLHLCDSAFVRFPTENDPECFFGYGNTYVYLLVSLDGDRIVRRFSAEPLWEHSVAVTVRFNKDQGVYFAVLGLSRSFPSGVGESTGVRWAMPTLLRRTYVDPGPLSQLYVFDAGQDLVYHEVIGDCSMALAAVPSDVPGEEALLVGGTGKVWRYRIARNDDSDSRADGPEKADA